MPYKLSNPGPGPRGARYHPTYKYAVYPGMLAGVGYISFRELCAHYGVATRECFEVLGRSDQLTTNLIPLRPREDGDYTLPT